MDIKFQVRLSDEYEGSLERVFKTPILCDVSKIHTGFGLMPRITGVTDDKDWGKPGSTKKVFAAGSWTQKGGYVSMDKVVERIDNTYWKIEVFDFQSWMLGFYNFTGEWETSEIKPGRVKVIYTYTLHSKTRFFYPLNWLFARLFWKRYMKQVMENIRLLIKQEEPYQYN